jgi:hypothetical protein
MMLVRPQSRSLLPVIRRMRLDRPGIIWYGAIGA